MAAKLYVDVSPGEYSGIETGTPGDPAATDSSVDTPATALSNLLGSTLAGQAGAVVVAQTPDGIRKEAQEMWRAASLDTPQNGKTSALGPETLETGVALLPAVPTRNPGISSVSEAGDARGRTAGVVASPQPGDLQRLSEVVVPDTQPEVTVVPVEALTTCSHSREHVARAKLEAPIQMRAAVSKSNTQQEQCDEETLRSRLAAKSRPAEPRRAGGLRKTTVGTPILNSSTRRSAAGRASAAAEAGGEQRRGGAPAALPGHSTVLRNTWTWLHTIESCNATHARFITKGAEISHVCTDRRAPHRAVCAAHAISTLPQLSKAAAPVKLTKASAEDETAENPRRRQRQRQRRRRPPRHGFGAGGMNTSLSWDSFGACQHPI